MTCRSCQYFEPDWGVFTATGWTGDGGRGECLLEPKPTPARADKPACRHWRKRFC